MSKEADKGGMDADVEVDVCGGIDDKATIGNDDCSFRRGRGCL